MFETVDTIELIPAELRAGAIERKDGKFSYEKPAEPKTDDAGPGAQAALIAERAQTAAQRKKTTDAQAALVAAQAEVQRLTDEAAVKGGALSADALAAINLRTAASVKAADDKAAAAELKATRATTRAALQLQAIASGSVRDAQTLKQYLDLAERFTTVDDKGNTIVIDDAGNPTGEALDKATAKGGSLRWKWAYLGTGSSGGGGEGSDDDATASTYDAAKAGREAGVKEKASRVAAAVAFT